MVDFKGVDTAGRAAERFDQLARELSATALSLRTFFAAVSAARPTLARRADMQSLAYVEGLMSELKTQGENAAATAALYRTVNRETPMGGW